MVHAVREESRKAVDKQSLLRLIQEEVKTSADGTVKYREFRRKYRIYTYHLRRYWEGGWPEALLEAGGFPLGVGRVSPRWVAEAALTRNYLQVAELLGRPPTPTELETWGVYGIQTYRRVFASFKEFKSRVEGGGCDWPPPKAP